MAGAGLSRSLLANATEKGVRSSEEGVVVDMMDGWMDGWIDVANNFCVDQNVVNEVE